MTSKPVIPMSSVDELMQFSKLLYDGGLQNKHCNSPAKVAARIVAGRELGLAPIQSINWIAIINGRAVIWGDAALALVRASGFLERIEERIEGDGDDRTAVCITKRKDQPERETRFSVADAKLAKLWGKDGPWTEYSDRQMMWRARGWNLRDNFGDVLSGLGIAEEELDVPVSVGKPVPTTKPATTPALAIEGTPVVSDSLLAEIGAARTAWLDMLGIPPEHVETVNKEWKAKLAAYDVTSAKQLTPEGAAKLLDELRESVRPKPPEAGPDPFNPAGPTTDGQESPQAMPGK